MWSTGDSISGYYCFEGLPNEKVRYDSKYCLSLLALITLATIWQLGKLILQMKVIGSIWAAIPWQCVGTSSKRCKLQKRFILSKSLDILPFLKRLSSFSSTGKSYELISVFLLSVNLMLPSWVKAMVLWEDEVFLTPSMSIWAISDS